MKMIGNKDPLVKRKTGGCRSGPLGMFPRTSSCSNLLIQVVRRCLSALSTWLAVRVVLCTCAGYLSCCTPCGSDTCREKLRKSIRLC